MRSWMKWAVAEGMCKTASTLLIKLVGMASKTLPGTFVATLIIGMVQIVSGIIGVKVRGQKLRAPVKQIVGSMSFGAVATIMTVLAFTAFTYEGADVGVVTFLTGLSIIPGAFADWIFFGDRLNRRQWSGIFLFLVAGYAMLDFPSLVELLHLPMWFWLSLAIAFFSVANESITRKIKKVDPFVFNFWVGLSTVLCCIITLTVVDADLNLGDLPDSFWVGTLLISVIVVGMISFKLMSYKDGGSIAIKKIIMRSVYLTGANVFGVIVYDEPLTLGKMLGIAGFLIAFTLTDNTTWEGIVLWLKQRRSGEQPGR